MKHKVLKQVEEQDYKEVEMRERERERERGIALIVEIKNKHAMKKKFSS